VGRLGAFLVILAMWLSMLGCGPEPLPRHFFIDARFTGPERGLILEAADKWNALGQELLDVDALAYDGIWEQDAEFEPIRDLGDDVHVVYVGSEQVWNGRRMYTDEKMVGSATRGDVIIYRFTMIAEETGEVDPSNFRLTVIHEFGHFLNLHHVHDAKSIMNASGESIDATGPLEFSRVDRAAFCCVYDCDD